MKSEDLFERENPKELINYLALYNKHENEYAVRLIYKKICSREITIKSQIDDIINDEEIQLINCLYQFKNKLDENTYRTFLKKIENKNIREKYELRYEIKKTIEEKEKAELNSYLNNKFRIKGYKQIKSIIRRKIDRREITTKDEIKQIMNNPNKIRLIDQLYSKNTPLIKKNITFLEDDIFCGKIKNKKDLNKKIDDMQKDLLKKYLSEIEVSTLKESKEQIIKKIDNGQIKSKEQIFELKKPKREISQKYYYNPKNDVSREKFFR